MNLYTDEMPSNCSECTLRIIELVNKSYIHQCKAKCDLFMDTRKTALERHKNCPLKPLPKCECGELKIQLHDAMCFYGAEKNYVDELEDKLAVAERAFILSWLDDGMNIKGAKQHLQEFTNQATAELKAEKGEGK